MAIRIDYTITDDATDEGGLDDVSVSGDHDNEQDSFVLVLHQNGSEISLTDLMARDLIEVIGRVMPK